MRKFALSKGPLIAAVAFAALSVVGLFWSLSRVTTAAEARKQNRALVASANSLLLGLTDAETGQRGYLLTGDTSFLAPYLTVRDSIGGRLQRLLEASEGRASAAYLQPLDSLVSVRMRTVSSLIELRRTGDVAAVLSRVRGGEGRTQMDSIRVHLGSFTEMENASLVQREVIYERDLRGLFIGVSGTGILAVLFAVAVGMLSRQRSKNALDVQKHTQTHELLLAEQTFRTRLQHANLALAEGEERLLVTLNSIGDAVMTTDAQSHVVRLNPVAERLTGWTMQDAAGRHVDEVFRIVAKDTRLPSTIPVAQTLEYGTIHGLANHTVLISRDGNECDIADSCAPIRDRFGVVVGAVLVFRDVTAEYEAQSALRDSSVMIETVLGTVIDGIVTFNARDGVVATANPAAGRIFGYAPNELIGHAVSDLVPELVSDRLDAFYDSYKLGVGEDGSGVGRGLEGRRKDGSIVPIEVAIGDMMLGGERYFTGIVRDLITRKEVERALRDAGALRDAIFNSANFSSIATDAKGVIQLLNVGAERMLGYAAADVLNKITPADISDPEEIIARARALSEEFGTSILPGFDALVFKASRGIEDIYELTYIRHDGSRFPAVVSVTALRDAQETIIGYLLIGTDNTARKQVEAEQRKLDQRLRDQQFYTRSLIESNIDALMTTDPSGIITDVNKQMEALTGCTRDELIGAPFKDYFTDPVRAEAAINLVLKEKTVSDFELTARSRDGKTTVVSYNATTFYDRTRILQGVFAAARDVTERKRVEEELKKATAAAESASRTKSEFLASMSHEIRTPMNAIMGVADLLAMTPLTVEQDHFVQIFRRAGDNLLNLINDILDLSKVEASQIELEQTGFSLTDIVRKIIEMVAARAEGKGLTLICDVAPNVPTDLIGDPTRLQQVLLNLLGNAIKFTETGTVHLRITTDSDVAEPTTLRFSVTDTGIGIPADQLSRVFERFTQADSSTTRRFGGSGLGLTICKGLVELMGGRIWAESTLDAGSVFAFVLPFELWVARADLMTATASTEPALLPQPLNILLVEDSVDNCTITLAFLAHTPYRVEIAANGAIAVEMFMAGQYDLVLMDRQMPVMDGLTATRRIRAWEQASHRVATPIIALTAAALKDDREQCLAAGCTAFLTKPIRQDVLLHAIAHRETLVRTLTREERIQSLDAVQPTNPGILERVPTFLQNRRSDVQAMRDALTRGDLTTVERLGHNMRGTGTSYGFQAITDIGIAIEEEAGRGDGGAAEHWVDQLSTYLTRIANDAVSR